MPHFVRLVPAAAVLCLLAPLHSGCGDDTGGGQGGTSSTSNSSSTSGTGGGGPSTTGAGGAGGSIGQGGSGAGGPYESCAEAGALDCFSNYDCPDTATRCENVGTPDAQVPCCVPGARGAGELGTTCTGENDCKSALCIELDGGTNLCTDTCANDQACIAELPNCIPIAFSGSDDEFCTP